MRSSWCVGRETVFTVLNDFFGNEAIVWIVGALLVITGLIVIAFHQYWKTVAGAIISAIGWFLFVRGFILLALPDLMQQGAQAGAAAAPVMGFIFVPLVIAGGWLTYVGWIRKLS